MARFYAAKPLVAEKSSAKGYAVAHAEEIAKRKVEEAARAVAREADRLKAEEKRQQREVEEAAAEAVRLHQLDAAAG